MFDAEHSVLREAVVETACNRWQSAEARWLGCAHVVPALAPFFFADICMRTGSVDQAIDNMAACDAVLPDHPYVRRLRERAVTVQQRRAANPEVVMPNALTDDDLRKAARMAVECHRWPQAIELWTQFLERGGSHAEAYRRLGTCYQNIGDYANSVLYFREVTKIAADPQIAEAMERSSRLEQRRFDSFLKHLQRFMQHPAFEVAQAAALAGHVRLGQDLHTLSVVTKSPIAGSIAPIALAAARPAELQTSVVLREINLAHYRRDITPAPALPTAEVAFDRPDPAHRPAPNEVRDIDPGASALPLIRPVATIPAYAGIPASSPSTAETASLIARLRAVEADGRR